MKISVHSIKFKIWLYFMAFALVILVGLWLFQIVFINGYYQDMKQQDVVSGANEIVEVLENAQSQEEATDGISEIASRLMLNVSVVDRTTGVVTSYNPFIPELPLNEDFSLHIKPVLSPQTMELIAGQILDNPDQAELRFLEGERGNTVVYAAAIEGVDREPQLLFVSSQLQPLDDTVKILSGQLVYVTIGILTLAILLSLFIAAKVSRPLTGITDKARELSSGNYDVYFEKGNYDEVNQLADTLNYATDGLKQVEKLRSELIANVSHDLKTPLTMIKAYAEMIRDISGEDREKRNQHLETIIQESDRLTDLVQDLLDISKLQAGMEEYAPLPFELDEMIQRVIGRFHLLYQQEGYTIQYESVGKPAVALGDEARLEQVMYNLIGNAINYTGPDKKVYVQVEELPEAWRISIRDTGEGIAEENLPYIWDRYYRANVPHEREVVGTGIGLSIVKSVLQLHESEFGVDSKKGAGSTFWFCLKKAMELPEESEE